MQIMIRTRCPVKHVPIDFDGSHGNEVIRISLGLLSGVHGGSGSTTYIHTNINIYAYIIHARTQKYPCRSLGSMHSSPTDRMGFNRPIEHGTLHTHT